MRLVHHEHRAVPLLDADECREVRHVAIGAVSALDDHDGAAVAGAQFREHRVARSPVVVRERDPTRARKSRPLQRAVMNERVAQHEVAGSEEM